VKILPGKALGLTVSEGRLLLLLLLLWLLQMRLLLH
jgi:hypothetical protein